MKSDLSIVEARRVALAAQGFGASRPRGRVDARHLRRVLDRLGLVQMDSVNVLVRAHYLPFFARLGPYPAALLDDLAYRRRELFEYWGHEASLIPARHYPLFRHRMVERAGNARGRSFARQRDYVESVLAEVRTRGPLIASELSDPGRRNGPWWGYSRGKRALEALFDTGRVAAHGRPNFARAYDLPERVLPAPALAAAPVEREEAQRALVALAARALGVATAHDLADYYRLKLAATRARIAELVDAGRLVPARVEGWSERAYLDPAARLPRRVGASALLAPFDPLVWFRDRVARLFDFHYRIEIYTPAPQRRYGYYVLPFLHDERLAGRVDLKADRAESALLVRGAYAEAGEDPTAVAPALAGELRAMATWLDLEHVRVARKGNLTAPLRAALD